MLKCTNCGRVNTRLAPREDSVGKTGDLPETGFCEGCGYYLGGRVCRNERCKAVNSLSAQRCRTCGKANLSHGAAYQSLSFVAPLLAISVLTAGGAVVGLSGIIPRVGAALQAQAGPWGLRLTQWFFEGTTLIVVGIIVYPLLPEPGQKILRGIATVLLHIVALPFRLLKFVGSSRKKG